MTRFSIVAIVLLVSVPSGVTGRQARHVSIDVKPGDSPTTVETNRGGFLPVAILSSPSFNATTVDAESIRVGPAGTEARASRTMREDVDRDGRTDLMALIRVQDLQLSCDDTVIRLTADTTDGTSIEGSEMVTVTGCPSPSPAK